MDFDLELCLMNRDGSLVPVRSAAASASRRSSSFRLVVGGRDYVGDAWNLGPLAPLVAQFAAVPARLVAGDVAIVRSGVEDQLDVPYYVFHPGDPVRISAFLMPDRSLAGLYPIRWYADGEADELYAAFRQRGEQWIAAGGDDTFRDLPVPRDPLIAAIRREVAAAARLDG